MRASSFEQSNLTILTLSNRVDPDKASPESALLNMPHCPILIIRASCLHNGY